MKRFLNLVIVVSGILFSPALAIAYEPVDTTTTGSQSTSSAVGTGDCDFTDIKHSIYGTESGGSPEHAYTAQSQWLVRKDWQGTAKGKYQFIPPTQEAYLNSTPPCPGSENCHGDKILTGSMNGNQPQGCWAVQECLMDKLLATDLQDIRTRKACQQALGKTITTHSPKGVVVTCTVTESGLLAAQHAGGPNACDHIAAGSEGDKDANGTSEGYYACIHNGIGVPGSCTPSNPGDPSLPPPTLTLLQYDTLTQQGDEGFINTGLGIKQTWVASMMLMAEQLSVNMEKQLEGIGLLLDAKEQAEAQRDFQQKTAEAHKDYQPSEEMCTFGTFARDLASTERRADLTAKAGAQQILQRELGSGDSMGKDLDADNLSRIKLFRDKYCNPKDDGGGLKLLCPKAAKPEMQNRDINYTETIDKPLSLDVDLTDDKTTDDEQTIFSLIDYLFMHDPITRVPQTSLELQKYQYHYQNIRSIIAMRGIARNSFANIIALKSASPEHPVKSGPYFKALIKEMGLKDDEVNKILGDNPSYYAQMEFLTKTIYQNPNFYTNLYDKPANVQRIRAAMRAIKLMNDRDVHDAMLRREMLLSMVLELKLRERAESVYDDTEKALFKER